MGQSGRAHGQRRAPRGDRPWTGLGPYPAWSCSPQPGAIPALLNPGPLPSARPRFPQPGPVPAPLSPGLFPSAHSRSPQPGPGPVPLSPGPFLFPSARSRSPQPGPGPVPAPLSPHPAPALPQQPRPRAQQQQQPPRRHGNAATVSRAATRLRPRPPRCGRAGSQAPL